MAGDAVTLSVPGPHGDREVRISSPTRVIWPEPGITKLELAEYLVAVGDAFIEANGDRPVSLQRFPGGIDGEQFFSKNPPKGAPEWVRSVTVDVPERAAASAARPRRARRRGLGGADEHHRVPPVGVARGRTPTTPTSCASTSTRSPAPASPRPCPRRSRCASSCGEAGLTAFVKTSGNRGIHVFAPIEPEHEFLDVRHAVIAARARARAADAR